jgi:hypothetical protein
MQPACWQLLCAIKDVVESVQAKRFPVLLTERREHCVIVATGRYPSEGFDDELLDTLSLALPISWRGTLTQYAGRLHQQNAARKDVIIYDYVDFEVPVLAKMYSMQRARYEGREPTSSFSLKTRHYLKWWRADLNGRPRAYESPALPLSYATGGENLKRMRL